MSARVRRADLDEAFERFTGSARAVGIDTTAWKLRQDTDRGQYWGVVRETQSGGHAFAPGQLYYLSPDARETLALINAYADAWRIVASVRPADPNE